MSKKKLPDHSLKAYSDSDPSIPVEFMGRVAKKFGFDSDFHLKDELEFAWFWYNTLSSNQESQYPIAETRELLDAFSVATWSLHNCISKFGPEERRLLGDSYQHLISREPSWPMTDEIETLARAADRALASIPKSKGGSQVKAETALARRLYDIYVRGTGQEATVSYSDIDECYPNPVVNFVCECMAVMGIPSEQRTNSAIGKKLSRIRSAKLENGS